ncbi:MAG: hypothetical protein DRN19_06220, partial [Thermoplasmata archaeon]
NAAQQGLPPDAACAADWQRLHTLCGWLVSGGGFHVVAARLKPRPLGPALTCGVGEGTHHCGLPGVVCSGRGCAVCSAHRAWRRCGCAHPPAGRWTRAVRSLDDTAAEGCKKPTAEDLGSSASRFGILLMEM